ncbi:MAG: DUF4837 family protein [Chloroflexota bacterium]|nr:DUF4837 family protein [Lentimicrobium sp.]
MIKSKSISALGVAILLLVFINSCKVDNPTKPSSKGSPSEVIVVAEDNLWKTTLADSIKAFFASYRPGLPQPEPLYKIAQIDLEEFDRLFETHRNILTVSIDSSLKDAKFETAYNVWAIPQRVIKITAPTIEMLKTSFEEHRREIYNLYENAEIERLQKQYSKTINIKASSLIKKKFNLEIAIPTDYFVAVEKDNFIWLRKEANTLSQGLLIYRYPYTDTVAYKQQKIIAVRNQFSSLYVPGPSDSSFMIVADQLVQPVSRMLTVKKELAVETRGLWEVAKDFMGGPFINYTLVDKKNNMVVALDGYVYAPNQDKAQLLRQVQSILLTFEFVEK